MRPKVLAGGQRDKGRSLLYGQGEKWGKIGERNSRGKKKDSVLSGTVSSAKRKGKGQIHHKEQSGHRLMAGLKESGAKPRSETAKSAKFRG